MKQDSLEASPPANHTRASTGSDLARQSLAMQRAEPSNCITSLHRTVGNRALGGMLRAVGAQPKLRVNQPGDVYEEEADRAADQVMRMSVSRREHAFPPAVQRSCASCAAGSPCPRCAKEEVVRRKITSAPSTVSESVPDKLISDLGSGRAMDPSLRELMESRFGQDFSRVRIHTDSQAVDSARALSARAFTIRNHVAFGAGEFSPTIPSGQRLFAHELVHVQQQGGTAEVQHANLSTKGLIQREDKPKIPGWNFTPANFAALRKGGKDLAIASDSSWVPSKLQDNILNTIRYTLDAKRSPSATEGINVKDFYHGHLVFPNNVSMPAEASKKRSEFETKKDEVSTATLGSTYGSVTKDNVGVYTKELTKILPLYGNALQEGVKIKGAAVIYHTFELSTPSDLASAGKNLKAGDPRRNYITPLDTNTPKPYSPPDPDSASSYTRDYVHFSQFAFLVGPDGAVHVRPGTTTQLSTVTGTPLD